MIGLLTMGPTINWTEVELTPILRAEHQSRILNKLVIRGRSWRKERRFTPSPPKGRTSANASHKQSMGGKLTSRKDRARRNRNVSPNPVDTVRFPTRHLRLVRVAHCNLASLVPLFGTAESCRGVAVEKVSVTLHCMRCRLELITQ